MTKNQVKEYTNTLYIGFFLLCLCWLNNIDTYVSIDTYIFEFEKKLMMQWMYEQTGMCQEITER